MLNRDRQANRGPTDSQGCWASSPRVCPYLEGQGGWHPTSQGGGDDRSPRSLQLSEGSASLCRDELLCGWIMNLFL